MTPAGKLIDKLNELKATSAERAAERKAEEERRELENAAMMTDAGKRYARDSLPDFKHRIIRLAERDESEYEIPVQSASYDYSLDQYDTAYAQELTQLFRDEGLTVEWVRETREPGSGSYYSFSENRYDTKLKITW